MIRKLYTIGYEGQDLHQFISTLEAFDVAVLLDVRELPASRRRGFSKSALRDALASSGIAYMSERRLGTPREIRRRVREDGDYGRFFRDFGRHLDAHLHVVDELVETLDGAVALMCYERDVGICHRLPVAKAFEARTGLAAIHL